MDIKNFNEKNFVSTTINRKAETVRIFDVPAETFSKYCEAYLSEGFLLKQKFNNGVYRYAAFFNAGAGVFLNYFDRTRELYIVTEKDCNYFDFKDVPGENSIQPQITQIELEDFGMSYVIRLSDGRFIVIDGGDSFEANADRLMQCLTENSNGKTPVIAAWIMTHMHNDHYQCFSMFDNKYRGKYIVEKFMLNFMELDDDRFPDSVKTSPRRIENTSDVVNVPIMLKKIEELGAPVFMPHTGQVYNIGDAGLEFLSGLDETVDFMRANVNATSLVFKMELGGQTILWTGDATFSEARLPQRYGEYIKCDILQVPHHGFEGPVTDYEIDGYKLANPETALLPVSDYNAYINMGIHRKGVRYLYEKSNVIDIATGDTTRVFPLPYTPEAYRRDEFKNKFYNGLKEIGEIK